MGKSNVRLLFCSFCFYIQAYTLTDDFLLSLIPDSDFETEPKKERKQDSTAQTTTNMANIKLDQNQVENIGKLLKLEEHFFPAEQENTSVETIQFNVPTVPPVVRLSSFQTILPSYAMKDDLINTINGNQVVLITGETGSGKSTQIPQYILEDAARNNQPCRILIALPRRLAVISTANRVSHEYGNYPIGNGIGYQIRMKNCASQRTSVIFMTKYV